MRNRSGLNFPSSTERLAWFSAPSCKLSHVCYALIQEGYEITEEDLSHMSPYITEHLKRFGEYVLDLDRPPANLNMTRDKPLFKTRNESLKYAA